MIDAFRIGVAIAVSSNGGTVLGALMRQMTGLHVASDKLVGKLNMVKAAAIGAVGVFASVEALRGMWALIDAAKQFNDELNKTQRIGGAYAANIGLTRATAFQMQRDVPTSDVTSNIALQREIASQVNRDPVAAAKIASLVAKVAYVTSSFTGEDYETVAKNLIKMADIRAKIFSLGPDGKRHVDIAKLQNELEAAQRGLQVGAPYVNSQGMLAMMTSGAIPFKLMRQNEAYGAAVEAAAAAGGNGSRVGTGLQAMFRQFVGGTMPEKYAQEWQRIGLLRKGHWSWKHNQLTTDAKTQAYLLDAMSHPFEFIEGDLNKLMDAKHLTDAQKLQEIFRIFSTSTAQRIAAETLETAPQIDRGRTATDTMPSADAQYKLAMAQDLQTNITALGNAWKGLMDSLGSAGTPMAIFLLRSLTTALQKLTAWSEGNQTLAGNLLFLAAALTTLTLAAASLGLIALGITALSSAIGTLVAPLLALGLVGGLLETGERHRTDKNYIGGPTADGGHRSMAEVIWDMLKPGPAGGASMPVHVTNAPVVHVGNAGQMGHAITSGMAGGLRAAPNGPSGATQQYRPRSPGM